VFRFPSSFVWGSATAALQIEGGAREDGKGPSVWDVFCAEHPERVFGGATPEVACDHYHRYAEDVRLMRELGHRGYRMSISWPRLFPEGAGALNQRGVRFYHRLFDALLTHGIEPNVTLYHWDLPQTLAARGGWENGDTIAAFADYAEACFRLFGDRVRLWTTFNEPGWSTLHGYVTGLHPPSRRDGRAAAQVAWNLLAAHGRALFIGHQSRPDTRIGIALNLSPVYPATEAPEDTAAAGVADGILNRLFLEPVLGGTVPEDLLELGHRHGLLPVREPEDERRLAQDTVDFLGVNYYFPHHASASARDTRFALNTSGRKEDRSQFSLGGLFALVRNPRGRYTDWDWEIFPEGLYDLLQRVHARRPGIPVYVTENGIGLDDRLRDGVVEDPARIEFVRGHLEAVHRAIAAGIQVRGYYMWSLMDNFSWSNGYKKRYGFLYVDRSTLGRYPKKSALWFRDVAENHGF
jgi:beta-galactosidase